VTAKEPETPATNPGADDERWLTYLEYDQHVRQAARRLGALSIDNVDEFRTLLLKGRDRTRIKEYEAETIRRLQGEAFVGDEELQRALIVLNAEDPHLGDELKRLVAASGRPADLDKTVAAIRSQMEGPAHSGQAKGKGHNPGPTLSELALSQSAPFEPPPSEPVIDNPTPLHVAVFRSGKRASSGASSNPAPSEPVVLHPARSEPPLSPPAPARPTPSQPALSERTASHPERIEPTISPPAPSERAPSEPTLSHPLSEPALSGAAPPEPPPSEPAAFEPTSFEKLRTKVEERRAAERLAEQTREPSRARRLALAGAVVIIGAVALVFLSYWQDLKPRISGITSAPELRTIADEMRAVAPAAPLAPVASVAPAAPTRAAQRPAPPENQVKAASAEDPRPRPDKISPASDAVNSSASDAAPVPGRRYKVVRGDMLSDIALQAYGDASKYVLIQKANPGLRNRPNKIFYDQVIYLPPAP
jgi:nucleoid-associated protein YgaU